MVDLIRTEAELQRRHGVGQHADSCDGCRMAATIRSLWVERDALQEMLQEWDTDIGRIQPVYDAAVAWRELDSAHTRGTLLAAVTAAEKGEGDG